MAESWAARRQVAAGAEDVELPADYYASDAYRKDLAERPDVAGYFERHDHEQFERLGLLRSIPLRGAVVADVGCAGGSSWTQSRVLGGQPSASIRPRRITLLCETEVTKRTVPWTQPSINGAGLSMPVLLQRH